MYDQQKMDKERKAHCNVLDTQYTVYVDMWLYIIMESSKDVVKAIIHLS